MLITVAWSADVRQKMKDAELANDSACLRKIARDVEAGNRVWESWALRCGGEVLASMGPSGQIRIEGEHLSELDDIYRQYKEAVCVTAGVGCGLNSMQAQKACELSCLQGGTRIVLYSSEIEKTLQDIENEKHLLEQPEPDYSMVLNKADPGLAVPGEASKIASGAIAPDHANPDPLEGGHKRTVVDISPSSSGSTAPAPKQSDPQELEALKQGVVGVLKQADAMVPVLEQLKAENPEVYEVVNGSVQAMIEMAKLLFGAGQVSKSEETPGESHGPEETSSPEPESEVQELKKETMSTGRHHLNLPVGSTHQGKVKVKHADGSVGWVEVRSGMIQSPDGHPTSVKSPESRSDASAKPT